MSDGPADVAKLLHQRLGGSPAGRVPTAGARCPLHQIGYRVPQPRQQQNQGDVGKVLLIEQADELAIVGASLQVAGNDADCASVRTVLPIDDLQGGFLADLSRRR